MRQVVHGPEPFSSLKRRAVLAPEVGYSWLAPPTRSRCRYDASTLCAIAASFRAWRLLAGPISITPYALSSILPGKSRNSGPLQSSAQRNTRASRVVMLSDGLDRAGAYAACRTVSVSITPGTNRTAVTEYVNVRWCVVMDVDHEAETGFVKDGRHGSV